MTFLRKNTMNILLFILWVGMGASLTTAHAEIQAGGATGESYSDDLAFITHLDLPLGAHDGAEWFASRGLAH